jgi:two-component system cell cycle sensor histidine kinase PleC
MMLSGAFGPLGDEKYGEYCRDIRESGTFLLRIISDILDMARLEAGRIEIDREPLDLNELIAETLETYAGMAAENGIEIVTKTTPDITLSADRQAVRQVLSNLISNAVKFTPEGGSIAIRTSRRREGAVLVVEDTGIGIPQPALEKLGQPFEQVQSPLTRSHKGSGLGLAISRSLVALHGGRMDIVSRQGAGTKVTVFLPFRPGAAGSIAAA